MMRCAFHEHRLLTSPSTLAELPFRRFLIPADTPGQKVAAGSKPAGEPARGDLLADILSPGGLPARTFFRRSAVSSAARSPQRGPSL